MDFFFFLRSSYPEVLILCFIHLLIKFDFGLKRAYYMQQFFILQIFSKLTDICCYCIFDDLRCSFVFPFLCSVSKYYLLYKLYFYKNFFFQMVYRLLITVISYAAVTWIIFCLLNPCLKWNVKYFV